MRFVVIVILALAHTDAASSPSTAREHAAAIADELDADAARANMIAAKRDANQHHARSGVDQENYRGAAKVAQVSSSAATAAELAIDRKAAAAAAAVRGTHQRGSEVVPPAAWWREQASLEAAADTEVATVEDAAATRLRGAAQRTMRLAARSPPTATQARLVQRARADKQVAATADAAASVAARDAAAERKAGAAAAANGAALDADADAAALVREQEQVAAMRLRRSVRAQTRMMSGRAGHARPQHDAASASASAEERRVAEYKAMLARAQKLRALARRALAKDKLEAAAADRLSADLDRLRKDSAPPVVGNGGDDDRAGGNDGARAGTHSLQSGAEWGGHSFQLRGAALAVSQAEQEAKLEISGRTYGTAKSADAGYLEAASAAAERAGHALSEARMLATLARSRGDASAALRAEQKLTSGPIDYGHLCWEGGASGTAHSMYSDGPGRLLRAAAANPAPLDVPRLCEERAALARTAASALHVVALSARAVGEMYRIKQRQALLKARLVLAEEGRVRQARARGSSVTVGGPPLSKDVAQLRREAAVLGRAAQKAVREAAQSATLAAAEGREVRDGSAP
jgi:hypothetical protein